MLVIALSITKKTVFVNWIQYRNILLVHLPMERMCADAKNQEILSTSVQNNELHFVVLWELGFAAMVSVSTMRECTV